MRTFGITEIKEHLIKDSYSEWLVDVRCLQVIVPRNIESLFKHLADGKEVPAFGVFEDERGYLKFKTPNIFYILHLFDAKVTDTSLTPLAKRKLQAVRIPVVISSEHDYLDLFL